MSIVNAASYNTCIATWIAQDPKQLMVVESHKRALSTILTQWVRSNSIGRLTSVWMFGAHCVCLYILYIYIYMYILYICTYYTHIYI